MALARAHWIGWFIELLGVPAFERTTSAPIFERKILTALVAAHGDDAIGPICLARAAHRPQRTVVNEGAETARRRSNADFHTAVFNVFVTHIAWTNTGQYEQMFGPKRGARDDFARTPCHDLAGVPLNSCVQLG